MTLETQQLFYATAEGDADTVRRLLAQGADANGFTMADGSDFCPLMEALRLPQPDILRLLLEHGAEPGPDIFRGTNPLLAAVMHGSCEHLRLLLAHGANPNEYGGEDYPLHRAAHNGWLDGIKLLLEWGADLHLQDHDDATALHHAAFGQHVPTLRYLLAASAREAAPQQASWLRLAHAALCEQAEELAALVRSGADLQQEDSFGYTVLDLATVAGEAEACARLLRLGARPDTEHNGTMRLAAYYGHVRIAQLLLEQGARLDSTDGGGDTLLHECAYGGYVDMARFLLQKGLPVHARNEDGETALHLAAENGHDELIILLLEQGAAAEEEDAHGFTPLGHAVSHVATARPIRLLLERGARLTGRGRVGRNILQAAACHAVPEIFELIYTHAQEAGEEVCPDAGEVLCPDAWLAYPRLHPAHIPFLLAQGAAPREEQCPLEKDALWRWADSSGAPQLGKQLLDAGADPNAANEYGQTPLHRAVLRGDCLCADMLLRAGANPNVLACEEATPLDYALPEHPECAELLLQHGADIDWMGRRRCSSLHLAAMNGKPNLVRWLLEHGAKLNRRCYDGKTPLQYAEEGNHLKTAQLLREYGVPPHQQ